MLCSLIHRHCHKISIINQIVRYKSAAGKQPSDVYVLKHKSKVPAKPTVKLNDYKTEKIKIDKETIELLQRLALVNLTDQ